MIPFETLEGEKHTETKMCIIVDILQRCVHNRDSSNDKDISFKILMLVHWFDLASHKWACCYYFRLERYTINTLSVVTPYIDE